VKAKDLRLGDVVFTDEGKFKSAWKVIVEDEKFPKAAHVDQGFTISLRTSHFTKGEIVSVFRDGFPIYTVLPPQPPSP